MLRALRLALIVAAACLVLPAVAQAQAVLLGSPLQNPPNVNLGCDTRLLPLGGGVPNTNYGDLVPTASGTPDCTWFQSGVWGVIDPRADPRVGTVPGNGTITRISVRSGPNPAPIRFVVGRNLQTLCCFFVAETSVSQPQPNTVTSFRVNLPVERNTNPDTGVRTDDFIGVSSAGPGSLPLHATGIHNTLNMVVGNPQAGAIYPRLSSASDTGGGTRLDGNPGFEVLLQVTFCPAGQPCLGPVLGRPLFGPAVFRVAPGRTPRVAQRAPAGTTLRFTLDDSADATVAIQRRTTGRRAKGRCAKPTRRLAGARRCTRWAAAGTLTRRGLPGGQVAIPFTGRIGAKALAPGRYRARITPIDQWRNKGRVGTATFRVVR